MARVVLGDAAAVARVKQYVDTHFKELVDERFNELVRQRQLTD